MAKIITRRRLLAGFAAASLLAGCDARHPVAGFLKSMLRFNERFEGLLFSPSRLAPEAPEKDLTPERAFPSYFIADTMPFPPAGWSLKVGGMVAHPGTFTLEQLKAMPRTDMRVRHHCVEGWSAVAAWHGLRLSELARVVGVDPRVALRRVPLVRRGLLVVVGPRQRATSADLARLRDEWARFASRPRRAAQGLLRDQARI